MKEGVVGSLELNVSWINQENEKDVCGEVKRRSLNGKQISTTSRLPQVASTVWFDLFALHLYLPLIVGHFSLLIKPVRMPKVQSLGVLPAGVRPLQ